MLLTTNNANSSIMSKDVKNESKLNTEIVDNLDLPDGLKKQLTNYDLTIDEF